ncbi:acyltransferase family protein [Paraburkholderia flava]|uniref:acyltransferase family protein n=1 Tax=Paraburkholderia flava TaxID=2547393 RepID=UPI00105FCB09|nr:acyltransferase [Paraburkholderia flava]
MMRANPLSPPGAGPSAKSLKIDAIRFMAAAWVVLYHFGPPPFKTMLTGHLAPLGGALWSSLVVLFAGPAAVIVFFVISGYCIHNAYHRDAALRPINYFASRYVRIGVPLAIVALVSQPVGDAPTLLQSVLWSLYCEIVYYTLYPLVRLRFHRIGEMIAGATLLGAAMVWFTHQHGQMVCDHCVYQNYGVAGTALLYLPGWLLGCLIADAQRKSAVRSDVSTASVAETLRNARGVVSGAVAFGVTVPAVAMPVVARSDIVTPGSATQGVATPGAATPRSLAAAEGARAPSAFTAWLVRRLRDAARVLSTHLVLARCVVIVAGSLTFVLASTSHIKPAFLPSIGPDVTLTLFQFLVAAWLAAETSTAATTTPGMRAWLWTRIGALGAWSYSLYLCHKFASAMLDVLGLVPGRPVAWLTTMVFAFALSYAFYLAVERPSHRLAGRLRKFAPKVPARPAT